MVDAMNLVHAKRSSKKKGSKKERREAALQAAQNGTPIYSPAKNPVEFNFDTIHGMKLTEMDYYVPPMEERKQRRAEFNGDREKGIEGVRSKFLKMLANEHEKELVDKLGLTQTDIDGMKKGFTPNGFNVHHKLPLHGGGKNEFSNFILTPLYPHDQWHHDVLDKQIEGIGTAKVRKVMLPWTDDMIYDPKKYGFYRDGKEVTPNYTSKVHESGYGKYWKADQISVEKRQEDMAAVYAQYAAQARGR